MKKMKKVIAMIMVVAIMFGGMVFGADTSKSFEITTTIPAMSELKIHQTTEVDTIAEFNNIGSAQQKTKHEFGSLTNDIDNPATINSGVYYLSVKTNAKTDTYIKATFNVMTGTDTANKLDYTLYYGTSSIKAKTNNGATLSIFTIPAANGARVVSNSFSIDILESDIKTAVPDSYSATITFQYTAS